MAMDAERPLRSTVTTINRMKSAAAPMIQGVSELLLDAFDFFRFAIVVNLDSTRWDWCS